MDYTYDSLNRLITATTTGPQWGLSFGYDGFGNRLTQTVTKGSAPASSLSVSAITNRISSSGYGYTPRFNRRHQRSSHLMQGRYDARLARHPT